MDGHAHMGLAHVHTVLLRYFRQAQGVAGRADQYGGTDFLYGAQSLQRVHAATRNGERTDTLSPLVSGPEADKGAEAKGQEENIVASDSGRAIDCCPASGPPIPALLRIQYLQGLPGRAGGLMEADVITQGIGEVAAK